MTVIDGPRGDTRNLQLAATIYAFDVPLLAEQPITTLAGDGIDGVRVTFHFEQSAPNGNSPAAIIKRWMDVVWLAENAEHPLAQAKEAFELFKRLTATAKRTTGDPLPNFAGGDSVHCYDNRQAAAVWSVGNQFLGYSVRDGIYRWHFHRAAAGDLALFERGDLHEALPDLKLSYVRASLHNHKVLTGLVKSVMYLQVLHRGRVANIGTSVPQHTLDKLERILYRK
jgi:hypothetical protein